MNIIPIDCPANLSSENAVEFQRKLLMLPNSTVEYELDFSILDEVTPFGMLVVGSAIRQLREQCPDSKLTMKNHTTNHRDAKSLATFMGFFESFGGPAGGHAIGGDSYLPITSINVQQLLAGEKYSKIAVIKKIVTESERLATVLCQGHNNEILKPVTYALREVMRNCLEHGGTHEFWYAAQYRPHRNRIEIAVLDQGRGIAESLRGNKELSVPDNMAALRLAIQPGVTGSNLSQIRSIDELRDQESEYGFDPSFYDNSGYGLYVLTELCKRNGNVLLLSGDRSLRVDEDGESIRDAMHGGTAVRIVLHPEDISDHFDTVLGELQTDVLSRSARLSASMLDKFQ